MILESNHISICICTYKRPDLLKRLLDRLKCQITNGLFSYSVIVVDNDLRQTAKDVVSAFAAESLIETVYCTEPKQNIALARNLALKNAAGNFVALIDDDELPGQDWLYFLFESCITRNVDGVLGPVRPYFEHTPPHWVTKGRLFDRPEHNTGYKMTWPETRTGNVLFKREIIKGIEEPFGAQFGTGGEDIDFFRRMIDNGKVFIWSKEAAVYELVPPDRCSRKYLIRRSLLRGGITLNIEYPNRARHILKSFVAIPIYGFALPFLRVAGDHYFMKYLIKLCDHAGLILGLFGINPIKSRGTGSSPAL